MVRVVVKKGEEKECVTVEENEEKEECATEEEEERSKVSFCNSDPNKNKSQHSTHLPISCHTRPADARSASARPRPSPPVLNTSSQ